MTTMMTTRIESSPAPVWHWRQHSFRAMGTTVHARLFTSSRRPLTRTVEDLFRYYEGLLSRFLPSSELSQLNAHDSVVFAASADFFAAVEAAVWAAQQTNGIFDPTILTYLERAGYDRTFAAVPAPRPLSASGAAGGEAGGTGDAEPDLAIGPDYRCLRLDPFARLIARPPGVMLDLGGMGKGWAVDRTVDELRATGAFVLNAGGDIFAYGAPPGERGWPIHLAHPRDRRLKIATLSLTHRAVATSTIAQRRWLQDGRIRHHLIDPRSGRPAAGEVVSVSVVGGRAFAAEVYAKVALILGVTDGVAYLESLPEIEGLLVTAAGQAVLTAGMAAFIERLDPTGYL